MVRVFILVLLLIILWGLTVLFQFPITSSAQAPTEKMSVTEISTSPKFTRTLRRGMRGEDIKELQAFLAQFKEFYPEGDVTGYFGPKTEAAVKRCQRYFGLQQVGVVGPRTRAKLNELWAKIQKREQKKIKKAKSTVRQKAIVPVTPEAPTKIQEQKPVPIQPVPAQTKTIETEAEEPERIAHVLEIPIPKTLDCFRGEIDSSFDEPKDDERCILYSRDIFTREDVQKYACPHYFKPVYDQQGIFYPNACWAERLGATSYQYGFSPAFLQFFRDLWYTPKEIERSYDVPVPNIEFSFTLRGSGSPPKVGAFFRSTLWEHDLEFSVLDYNIDASSGIQRSTTVQRGVSLLSAQGPIKVLLAVVKFDGLLYPDDFLLQQLTFYNSIINRELRKHQRIPRPLQLEITPVIIDSPEGVRKQDFRYTDPKTGEKKRMYDIVLLGDIFTLDERQKIFDAAIMKLDREENFDVFIISPDHLPAGSGIYQGIWNDMEYIMTGLAPQYPYSESDIHAGISAIRAIQRMFRVILHELFHARGWPADHFPEYVTSYKTDLTTGKELDISMAKARCEVMGNALDFMAIELPIPFTITVGQEPDWATDKVKSSTGSCFIATNPGGFFDLYFKDQNQDGKYELMYYSGTGHGSMFDQYVPTETLPRVLGWTDGDGDGIGEIADPDPYGGFQEHDNYTPNTEGELIPISSFEPLEEVSIDGCRFQRVTLESDVAGLVPLQCKEFNQDIVNLYRMLQYQWLKIQKSYGTVLLPRLPNTNAFTTMGEHSVCSGKKIYKNLDEALKEPEKVCALDLETNYTILRAKQVPPDIGKFKNLEYLNLRGNELTNLPAEIWELTNLKVLNIRGNHLDALSNKIGQLVNLQILNASVNRLLAVPDGFKNLINLKKLYLFNNYFPAIPEPIFHLMNIEVLNLHDQFPGGILNPPSPKIPWKTLNPEIRKLKALKELDLRSNGIDTIPPEIGELMALQDLRLSFNDIQQLPEEIAKLKNLRRLTIPRKNRIWSDEDKEKVKHLLPLTFMSFSP